MRPPAIRPGLRVALAAAAAAGGCKSQASEPKVVQAPPGEVWLSPAQVESAQIAAAPVDEANVGETVTTSGRVTFDDLRVSHVFSPVTGRVTRILAEPGQRVAKGAPLVTIESPDVGSAFAELNKAQADLLAAEHDYERQKGLFQAHAGSQRDYEAAEDNYGKAKAEMERARQKARLLRSGSADAVSQEYTLRSLIAGEVIARNVNPGIEVQGQYSGGSAVELFTVGELDSVWVVGDIFEMDLARVKKGADVAVRVVAYPRETFHGRVEWVADSLDPATRTAKVRCSIANPDRELKPEMYAEISITVSGQRSLAIPRGALVRLGDETVVFVQAGAGPEGEIHFQRRVVGVDPEQGDELVAVTRGLARGERVVTSGAILLSGML